MPIFKSSYHTYIGRRLNTEKIKHELITLQVSSKTLASNTTENDRFYLSQSTLQNSESLIPTILTPATSLEQAIPVFYHPFALKQEDIRAEIGNWLVGDARSFMRVARNSTRSGETEVSNVMEFEFLKARLGLESVLRNRGVAELRYISPVLQSIYASWIAQNIRRRFNLDMGDQMKLQVLAALFYHCLFLEEEQISEANGKALKLAPVIAKYAKAPIQDSITIIDQAGYISGAEDFVNKVKMALDNPRLEDFNVDVFMTIISGTWFGMGGREIAAVAVEHIPTFVAMVYMSFAQRGYRNAGMSLTTEAYKGAKGEADITRAVQKLLFH